MSKLNILVLYDDHSTYIGTVQDHIGSFKTYSRNAIFYLPASYNFDDSPYPDIFNFDIFDVVILHYSVRLTFKDYFQASLAQHLENFSGLKIVFLQDEYEATEMVRCWLDRIQFDIVYTCVPPENRQLIYPGSRFSKTEFRSTLTGFVPEYAGIEDCALPLEQRHLMLAYRGRLLNPVYGELGREKMIIGTEMRRISEERGLVVDIEIDDDKRIYGNDWYRFLGSARATLGSESGSNVFDFDGSILMRLTEASTADPSADRDELYRSIVAPHEGPVKMNQVSPKIFEAIRLRTALILFEGDYSGVVKPDIHYIPLKKDFSNSAEILDKIEDLNFVRKITEQAYNDIIRPGLYSYRKFIEEVDETIMVKYKKPARFEFFSTPLIIRNTEIADEADGWKVIAPSRSIGFALSTGILSTKSISRYEVEKLMDVWLAAKVDGLQKLGSSFSVPLSETISKVPTIKVALKQMGRAFSILSMAFMFSIKYRIKRLLRQ